MASNDLFGWNLLYNTIKDTIKTKSDVIVALAHWFLVKNSFLCAGSGDDKTLREDECGREVLPSDWNNNKEVYSLRYIFDKRLYILLAAKADNKVILNFLDPNIRDMSNVTIIPYDVVKCLDGPLKMMIPDTNSILNQLKEELLNSFLAQNTIETSTQTLETIHSPRFSNTFTLGVWNHLQPLAWNNDIESNNFNIRARNSITSSSSIRSDPELYRSIRRNAFFFPPSQRQYRPRLPNIQSTNTINSDLEAEPENPRSQSNDSN